MIPMFGYHMPNYTVPGVPADQQFERIADTVVRAEKAGFGLVTVMDHFYQIGGVGPETEPMLEAYTTLAGLAARTSTIRLGTLVTGVTYRNPAVLAKTVTTLDVISGGRALFGLGAAWNEAEHRGYGIDFPPLRERMDRLDEALTIARAMFTQERPTFGGRYYRIDRALNSPRPVQPGGPPILVGGGGERRTLRIAAKHADMTHWFALGLDALTHKTEVLAAHCEAIGRDPGSIARTIQTPVLVAESERDAARIRDRLAPERRPHVTVSTPEQAAAALRPYLDAGFAGFTFNNFLLPPDEGIELVGELIRLVGAAPVAVGG